MMNLIRQRRWENKALRIVVLVLGCTFLPTMGLAQPKTTTIIRENPWPSIEARVEKLYNDGIAAADKKQWEKARKHFADAFDLDRRPQIAANLGNAELAAGKARDAAEHLDYFLNEDKEADADARAEVKALFDSAALRIVIVKVTVDQVGADVFVNREFVGKSPLNRRLFLEPGEYTFEATMAGVKPGSQSLELSRGASVGVKLVMGEATNGTVLANGTVQTKQKERDWRIGATIGAGSLLLAGVGVGIASTIAAKDNADEWSHGLDALAFTTPNRFVNESGVCEDPFNWKQCEKFAEQSRNGTILRQISVAGFVIAGVSLVGIGVVWALPKGDKNAAHISPTLSATHAGLLIEGSIF